MDQERIKELLQKQQLGKLTKKEAAILETWYVKLSQTNDVEIDQLDMSKRLEKVWANIDPAKTVKTGRLKLVYISSVAAALLISCIVYLYKDHFANPMQSQSIVYGNDIGPGKNEAVLTMADGKKIVLNENKSGIVIGASTLTYNDGSAIEQASINNSTPTIITTPRGGQYHIELPDGTKVALNAASTLHIHEKFRLNNRIVKLSGEAYFEVAKDKQHPFIVMSGTQEVEVLGTHFNVMAYADESAIKTTLVEGLVSVSDKGVAKRLKPGELAINNGAGLEVRQADLDTELAWKRGRTEFLDADIKTIMAMLKRWYNIEVTYQGKITPVVFSGSVSRTKNISEVLSLLESTGDVHFKIEGRRVIVME